MSSSRFSPALQASDLNDFIAPSQDCIISLNKNTSSSRRLQIKQKENAVSTKPAEEAVKISLKDCLACSGCITSAETVMLEKQNLSDFITRINSNKAVIVSVSPQSRASLAAFFGLTQSQVLRKLTALFKSMGVKAIYDTSSSRDLSLIEACNEFVSRYQKNQSSSGKEGGTNLPMLSSACPGWICYAEKTLGSYILPYISSVKSPQQAIGAAIKHHMVEKLGLKPYDVYHVTVMPCYDKKLEAVRDDFIFSVDNKEVPEVDSVLTTGEVLDLIQSKSVDFKILEESSLDRLLTNVDEEGHLYGVSGGSGGYAETVFRHAARVLYKSEIEGPLDFRILRNSDLRELTLEQVEGKPVLKFALCYGFRNLQNIVRKIKMGKCEYHFIEVMACPSGCLNGGGQIKPVQGQSAKELIQLLENVYTQDVSVSNPFDNPITKRLYDEWLGQPGSENAKRYLHTDYHPVVKSVASQLQNW
ncbi:protein NAR1-like isoform X1 [Phragmites australis]|uniref:protein NAR1-like isoform X1 n=1 Tax=Phragmites australis TaxID=29695 RepID=UPI002D77E9A0|nr:protein NAR1-like isoform X1 [Phragmites australis]